MTVDIKVQDGVQIVRLQGEMTGDNSDFIESITNLLTGPDTRILIDLHEVPFINSTGLNDLVRVTAQSNVQEGRVVLANLSPFVDGVLRTTQLHRFFEVYPTTDEALAKLR